MPRIPDDYLRSVVFLYPSRRAAEQRDGHGGSGFVGSLHRIGEVPGPRFLVTNQHVAAKAEVALLRTDEDEPVILDTPSDGWHHHPDGDDVSVFPLDVDSDYKRFPSITQTTFVDTEERVRPGDDVFMLGRFVIAQDKQLDAPTARFGHLAMYGTTKLRTGRGIDQESFLVETLSIPGYSGSPVVAFRLHLEQPHIGGIRLSVGDPRAPSFDPRRGSKPERPVLLGVDWGHVPETVPVRQADGTPTSDKLYVQQNRGMIGVVPAWKITDILETEELRAWKASWERSDV